MLKQLFFLQYGYGAQFELTQSLREGKDVEKYREIAQKIDAIPMEEGMRNRLMYAFWDQMACIPASSETEKAEPSDYERILALRKKGKKLSVEGLSEERLFDKVYGAWLGRVIGCMFGKPVEGLKRNRIEDILKKLNNYPMRDYIVTGKDREFCKKEWINFDALVENYGYAPADDDTDYTVIGLTVLEKYGKNFTTEDIAEEWIKGLPAISCCTAEFCAYRNILNKVFPPFSATYRNPFREWIGAQIRGDIFGYVAPFDPERAAKYAYTDARLSHTKNGIYGEMFVAAMLAAAYGDLTVEEVIEAGLSQIPHTSRLYKKIEELLCDYRRGMSFEEFKEKFYETYNENDMSDSVHTIPNALIVVACLLYSRGDFAEAIGNAVTCGFDTDCNGATVGSVMGLLYGAKSIPERLSEPLHDRLETDIKGNYSVSIRDLARRTIDVIKKKEGKNNEL